MKEYSIPIIWDGVSSEMISAGFFYLVLLEISPDRWDLYLNDGKLQNHLPSLNTDVRFSNKRTGFHTKKRKTKSSADMLRNVVNQVIATGYMTTSEVQALLGNQPLLRSTEYDSDYTRLINVLTTMQHRKIAQQRGSTTHRVENSGGITADKINTTQAWGLDIDKELLAFANDYIDKMVQQFPKDYLRPEKNELQAAVDKSPNMSFDKELAATKKALEHEREMRKQDEKAMMVLEARIKAYKGEIEEEQLFSSDLCDENQDLYDRMGGLSDEIEHLYGELAKATEKKGLRAKVASLFRRKSTDNDQGPVGETVAFDPALLR